MIINNGIVRTQNSEPGNPELTTENRKLQQQVQWAVGKNLELRTDK